MGHSIDTAIYCVLMQYDYRYTGTTVETFSGSKQIPLTI